MAATVTLSAVREYCQPADCSEPDCDWPGHPEACPDVWPDEWREWIYPDPASAYRAGWRRDVPDPDAPEIDGDPFAVTVAPWTAAAVIRDWHGTVWNSDVWSPDGRYREGEYSTECYRTGRESLDTLFVGGPSDDAIRLAFRMADSPYLPG